MIITMMKPVSVEINPGDTVELIYDGGGFPKFVTVRRLTVRNGLIYAVFSNDTWRPLSSFNRTWKKVENA